MGHPVYLTPVWSKSKPAKEVEIPQEFGSGSWKRNRLSLNRHVKRVHVCKECGAAFSDKNILFKHLQKHRREEQFCYDNKSAKSVALGLSGRRNNNKHSLEYLENFLRYAK